ncbi:MAG: hypothetical protein HYX68_12970 [Planctomycetes bacterium]|nr:hypothetical protein [Planctomycetota bacterium]
MSAFAVMWAPLLFGCALFLSAALLFVVQPMVGRTLLPHLGGTPLAWSACLVFFQATLLAGYVYADLAHRFRGLRWQPLIHLVLLLSAIILSFVGVFGDGMLLAVAPRLESLESWPIVTTFCLLFVVVGAPFFALSAVSPLVQRWFAHLDHPKSSDPYFLFVASNLGALSGLVIYVLLIEPAAPLYAQWLSWKLAALALAMLLFLTALVAWRSPRSHELEPAAKPSDPDAPVVPKLIGRGPATWPRRFAWFVASALPVGLLLAVTDYLTLDVAPAPILWAVPLALYLLAFTQAFGRFAPLEQGPLAVKITLHVFYGIAFLIGVALLAVAVTLNRPGNADAQGFLAAAVAIFLAALALAPSTWVWVLQPLFALALVFSQANLFQRSTVDPLFILFCLAGYYLSVRVCLEALARDRPAAPALTGYYAWMGLGGVCGGLFQLIAAPILFPRNYLEYSFLAALACSLRANWIPHGLTDWVLCWLFFRPKKDQPAPASTTAWKKRIALFFDLSFVLPVALIALLLFVWRAELENNQLFRVGPVALRDLVGLFGDLALILALVAAVFLILRPLRFGLALSSIVLLSWIGFDRDRSGLTLVRERTPFGLVNVRQDVLSVRVRGNDPEDPLPKSLTERRLMHATTHHGSCITEPVEMLRYPTTYYHRKGPVGRVMRNLEWFPLPAFNLRQGGPDVWLQRNRDNAKDDARIAASLVGLSAPLGIASLPMAPIAGGWSEPPFACVGLGTGTLFTYAHPYQWVDAYELDPAIIRLSEGERPTFHYFQSAKKRGVQATLVPGDGRRSLTKPRREQFYHVIFVDAFNSDAVPVHLLTQEAVAVYFQNLAPDGVVCFHTSNRYVDLNRVLESVAKKLRVVSRPLQYSARPDEVEPLLFSSEWTVLARNQRALDRWTRSDAFEKLNPPPVTMTPRDTSRLAWSDEHASLMSAVRQGQTWVGLIYALLILVLFFGMLLGLIELVFAMVSRARTATPSSGKEKTR